MAKPAVSLQRRIDASKFQRAAQTRAVDTIIFLAGPFIDPDDEHKSGTNEAAILRFKLFHSLTAAGFLVSLGEYRELVDSYKDELGIYHNAAMAELDHAHQNATAVVMIPSSPGSFAEFGAFVMKTEICEKMIILGDEAHASSDGYINTGPVALAKAFHAEVHFLKYSDYSHGHLLVEKFVRKIEAKNLVQRRLKA